MVKYAKQVAVSEKKLQVEERNILSVAYKNVVGMKRNSRRLLTGAEDKEIKRDKEKGKYSRISYPRLAEFVSPIFLCLSHNALGPYNATLIKQYRNKIEDELKGPCMDVIDLLDTVLIPNSTDDSESNVFYLKMKGDYYRYLCEFLTGGDKQDNSDKALEAYEQAQKVASSQMKVTDPVRLGLALNFSVFYY